MVKLFRMVRFWRGFGAAASVAVVALLAMGFHPFPAAAIRLAVAVAE